MLQYLHSLSCHPPHIGVEDHDIDSLPVLGMLVNGPGTNYSMLHSMHDGIIGV